MTIEMLILFMILGIMVTLFLTEKIPIDLTALIGVLILTILGYIAPNETFSGFSSPAIITMISMFFIGGALAKTGVAEVVARYVHSLVGSSEFLNVFAVMVLGAFLSAFMNNVAATVILLPAVAGIATHAEIAPSRLFIPLSFGVILGGTTTLIGTTANIVMLDALRGYDIEPFGFLEFTPFGLPMAVAGIIFVAVFGRKMLPVRDVARRARERKRDLAGTYRLFERIFSLKIPSESSLVGMSLGEVNFPGNLGVYVVAIVRDGRRMLAPAGSDILEANDLILVQGRQKAFEQLLKFKGVQIQEAEVALPSELKSVTLQLEGDGAIGKTVQSLGFRERHGGLVLGIERGEERVFQNIRKEILQKDDRLLVLVKDNDLQGLEDSETLSIEDVGDSADDILKDRLFGATIPYGSDLTGATIKQSRVGELLGLTVIGVCRGNSFHVSIDGSEEMRVGDTLIVSGDRDHIVELSKIGELEVEDVDQTETLESANIGFAEIVLSPRSQAIGRTLIDIEFREKYGFQVLAIWRGGKPSRSLVANKELQLGDALLLQGPRRKMHLLAEDPDFVVLSEIAQPERRTSKAPVAVMGLLTVVLLSVFKLQPIQIAAFIGAAIVVLGGAIKMDECYREVEWRVVFLISCLIPFGIAFESTGAASLLASTVVGTVGELGPYAVLLGFALLSSLLSQSLDGAVAVLLLSPVTIETATELGVDPRPFLITVVLSASIAFVTPFSHKANLLVMGAGGYRVRDYFRVGSFLSIISIVSLVAAIYFFMPIRPI